MKLPVMPVFSQFWDKLIMENAVTTDNMC